MLLARALHNLSNVTTVPSVVAYLERMRDAGRRAGFDNMVAANYHVRLADMALLRGRCGGRVGARLAGRRPTSKAGSAIGRWRCGSGCCSKTIGSTKRTALLGAWSRHARQVADDKHRLSSPHLMLAGRRHDPVEGARRWAEVLEEVASFGV